MKLQEEEEEEKKIGRSLLLEYSIKL